MLFAIKDGEEEPSIDTDKLSYEIFSILESKFLFGYDEDKLWVPKPQRALKLPAATSADVDPNAGVKNQRGKVCILSIDGGGGVGMRGILPGKALPTSSNASVINPVIQTPAYPTTSTL
ncbi:hypothetical protein HPP92_012289 [Vanilla planifolia]|uniref:Uncharacterized protein n=1 Tax=Vanilla planifolia TaxID=51239 RepID=A0A835QWN0_VANPL|nr:hypothetical protein HPP92_012289 [Vanilla planifolia]